MASGRQENESSNKKSNKEKIEQDILKLAKTIDEPDELKLEYEKLNLVERSKNEKIHPVYSVMLGLISAQVHLLETPPNVTKSEKYIMFSCNLIEFHKNNLANDSVWKLRREILEKLFGDYFVFRMTFIINEFTQSAIAEPLTLICGDYDKENLKFKISDAGILMSAVSSLLKILIYINQVLLRIHAITLTSSEKYIRQESLIQNYIMFYSLEIILNSLMGLTNNSSYNELASYNIKTPTRPKSRNELQQDLFPYFEDLFKFLAYAEVKWSTHIISQRHSLFFLSIVSRIITIYFGATDAFQIFSQYFHNKLIAPNFKKITDPESQLYLSNMNADHMFEFCDVERFQYDEKVLARQIIPNIETLNHPKYHINILWDGVCDVLFKSFLRDFLFNAKKHKGKNQTEKIMNYSADLQGRLNNATSYALLQHDFLLRKRSILDAIKPSLNLLKKMSSDKKQITDFYLPLPFFPVEIFIFKSYLPTVASLQLGQFNEKAIFDMADYNKKLRILDQLEQFYTDLDDIFSLFIENPMWFSRGTLMADSFKKNIMLHIEYEKKSISFARVMINSAIIKHKKIFEEKTEGIKTFADDYMFQEKKKRDQIIEKNKQLRAKSHGKLNKEYWENKNVITKNNATSNDDDYADVVKEDPSDKVNQHAVNAHNYFSQGFYEEAEAEFKNIFEHDQSREDESIEGQLLCKIQILTKDISTCIEFIHKIMRDPDSEEPQNTRKNYDNALQIQDDQIKLSKDFDALLLKLKLDKTDKPISTYLKEYQQKLKNLEELVSMGISLYENLADFYEKAQYEFVMTLGVQIIYPSPPNDYQKWLDFGYLDAVKKQKVDTKSPEYKKYKEIYDAGYKKFISFKSKDGKKKGIRRKHCEQINLYMEALKPPYIETSKNKKKSKSTAKKNVKPAAPKKSVPEPDIQSVKELFDYLQLHHLLDQAQLKRISNWVKKNPLGLKDSLLHDKTISSQMAWNVLCGLFINLNFNDRIFSWDSSGIWCWFFSITNKSSLFTSSGSEFARQYLAKINMQLQTTPPLQWPNTLIFAQILTALVIAAFEPDEIASYLNRYAKDTNPIHIINQTLKLSEAIQDAWCAWLAIYVASLRKNSVIKLPDTLLELRNATYSYNLQLFNNADVRQRPRQCMAYRSTALQLTNKTSDTDMNVIYTGPVESITKFKMEADPNQYSNKIYHRWIADNKLENNIHIKVDSIYISQFTNQLIFTTDQLLFDLVLMEPMYLTEDSYHHSQAKIYVPIKPLVNLRDNAHHLLLYVSATKDPQYRLVKTVLSFLKEKTDFEILETKSRGGEFLTPLFNQGALLNFLYSNFVYDSAARFITLVIEYHLLPYFFPIPLSVYPIAPDMDKKIIQRLEIFDKTNAMSKKDGRVLLAELIIIFVMTVTEGLPNREELCQKALLQLEQMIFVTPMMSNIIAEEKKRYHLQNSSEYAKHLNQFSQFAHPNYSEKKPVLIVGEPIVPRVTGSTNSNT